MLRGNDISALQGSRSLGQPGNGRATGLIECEVVAVHAHGTLDAKAIGRRAVTVSARYPRWYEPQLEDRVLVAELQGDERMRVVLQAMSTKSGGAPKVVA